MPEPSSGLSLQNRALSALMLVNAIRETLRLAQDVAADASVALHDFAVEVQEVRSWSSEAAQREVTAFALGCVPPKNSLPRPALESGRALQPYQGRVRPKKGSSRSGAQTERAPRRDQGSSSSSQTKAAKNQVRASLRSRGGVGIGTAEALSAPGDTPATTVSATTGCADVGGSSSNRGKSLETQSNGCNDGECHSARSMQHEATCSSAPVHERSAVPEDKNLQIADQTLSGLSDLVCSETSTHSPTAPVTAEAKGQQSPTAEKGEGRGDSRSQSEPPSSPLGTLMEQVEGGQEDDGEEMGLECTRQKGQQGCAEGEETRKLHQEEVAKRRWAEAVKKVRLMREQEEAAQVQGQVVLAFGSPRTEVQDDDEPIYVDEDKRYSLEQLTQTKVWQSLGVQPWAREFYLTDDEFGRLFEMDRHDYIKLPKWKRIDLKKKHSLF